MPKYISDEVNEEVLRQAVEARRLGQKLSVNDLYEHLRKKFGKGTVGRTTVWKLLKKALKNIKQDVLPDPHWDPSPLVWAPEAYPFLLAMDRYCLQGVERSGNDVMPTTESSQLTDREAKWGATLFATLKDAPIPVAYYIVRTFTERQTVAQVYEQSIRIADLVGYLEYKPWESPQAAGTYEVACELGRTPKLGAIELVSSQEPSEIPDIEVLGETVEIKAFQLSELVEDLDAMLATPERQNWHDLQNIVERAEMIKQVAIEKIYAINWESRPSREDSEPIHGEEATKNEGTSDQAGKE